MIEYFERYPDSPKVKRLPMIIWSRLYTELQPYMTELSTDGTLAMSFYHRQVAEAVSRRYLEEKDRLAAHLRLGDYFHRQDYWAEAMYAQRVGTNRLVPVARPVYAKLWNFPFTTSRQRNWTVPRIRNPHSGHLLPTF